MNKIESLIIFGAAFIASGFTKVFGENPDIQRLVVSLLIVILFDIVTGLIASKAAAQSISSQVWHKGMFKKFGIITCVVFAAFIKSFNVINFGVDIVQTVTTFFLIGEVISVFENLIKMGVPMPQVITKFLEDTSKPLFGNKGVQAAAATIEKSIISDIQEGAGNAEQNNVSVNNDNAAIPNADTDRPSGN